MIETTFICDRCGARHTGSQPDMWKSHVTIEMDADNLATYSPYYIREKSDLLCSECCQKISNAIRDVLEPVPTT